MKRWGIVALILIVVILVYSQGYRFVGGDRYDPATYMFALSNLEFLRGNIVGSMVDSDTNMCPVGYYDYMQIQEIFPYIFFPENPEHAGWLKDSFYYQSQNGHSFTISIRVNDGEKAIIKGVLQGVIEEYQHPMAGGEIPKYLKDNELRGHP